jgi:diguanylate cyclase (GGDEF)-like protein
VKIILSLYLVFAVILTQFFAAYFFSKGRTSYRKAFSAVVLGVSIYLFGYLMIINASNLQEMIFWNQFQYFGLPFIPVLWLIVALLYTKTIYSLSNRMLILLFAVPVITLIIRQTNMWHHFFYTSWGIGQCFGYSSLYLDRGFWYYVNISYTILCLITTIVIYIIGFLRNKVGSTRAHFMVFLIASFLPLLGIVMLLFSYERMCIDYVAILMPITLLIISYGILKFDFLEIRTLARETIFENNLAGMVVLGPGKIIVDYNKAAEKFFENINITLNNYPIDRILKNEPKLLEIFGSEENQDYSLVIDGEERFFEIDTVPIGNLQDVNMRMLKSIRDVTEERKIQRKLKFLATTDSLSGLYNRAEFMDLAQMEFALAKMNNEELSLLMIDIDKFKNINDSFGHSAGDEVIREIGRMTKNNFRKTDIAGRIGGEEFAVILKNATLSEAEKVAEMFREAVSKREVIYGEDEISFTVSIGVASIHGDNDIIYNIEDTLKMADDALYKAKAKGRNCVVTYVDR